MEESETERINLVRVCNMLADRFSTSELLAICSDMGLNGEELGIKSDPPRVETIVALVARLDKQNRVPELLMACDRRRPGVAVDMLFKRPPIEWTPRKLPRHIVKLVNDVLGVKGESYSIFVGDWVATGCFRWSIPIHEWEDITPVSRVNEELMKVREALANDPVTIYKGNLVWQGDRAWSNDIVVAATTDQFDILRIERTEAVNAHLDTAGLIYELQKIDQRYGIDLIGAGNGVVEFALTRTPTGQEAEEFLQWLLWLDLGPDVIPPGEELPKEFLAGTIGLWWD